MIVDVGFRLGLLGGQQEDGGQMGKEMENTVLHRQARDA